MGSTYTAQQQGRAIDEFHAAAGLHTLLEMGASIQSSGALCYLQQFLADAGEPTDPIERAMVQQLALAHHRIIALHARSAEARDIKIMEAYHTAARQLLAEFRRLAMALRDYRTPLQGKSTTVIHRVEQWNQARGDQSVGYARTDTDPESRAGGTSGGGGSGHKLCRDDELTSNELEDPADDLHRLREQRLKEPASRRSRAHEPAQT